MCIRDRDRDHRYTALYEALLGRLFSSEILRGGVEDYPQNIFFIEDAVLEAVNAGSNLRLPGSDKIDLRQLIKELAIDFPELPDQDEAHMPLATSEAILLNSPDIRRTDMHKEIQAMLVLIESEAHQMSEPQGIKEWASKGFGINSDKFKLIQEKLISQLQETRKQLLELQKAEGLIFQVHKQVRAFYIYDPHQLSGEKVVTDNVAGVLFKKRNGSFEISDVFNLAQLPNLIRSGELPLESLDYARRLGFDI